MKTYTVYALYARDGSLLYIGRTINPTIRKAQHSSSIRFRGITFSFRVKKTYSDITSAAREEARLIRRLKPPMNKNGFTPFESRLKGGFHNVRICDSEIAEALRQLAESNRRTLQAEGMLAIEAHLAANRVALKSGARMPKRKSK